MNRGYVIKTTDLHTGGEPLRIIESIEPAVEIYGNDILEKLDYIKTNLDWIRRMIIDEPRGHEGMYGAMILESTDRDQYDFGVIFMHGNGYSTMCGHGTIVLTRYAFDKKLIDTSRQTLRILCPCGIVECSVSERESVLMSTFTSVPCFLLHHQLEVHDPELGTVLVDISFGGNFFVIVREKYLQVRLGETEMHTVMSRANRLKREISKTTVMKHPTETRLEVLSGVIIIQDVTDEGVHRNVVVFADTVVDRSPCGSGTTAQMAALYFGNNKNEAYRKPIKFQNALLKEKSEFSARVKDEVKIGGGDNEVVAARIEVTGTAFYTGRNEFFYEASDPLKEGFRFYN